MKVLLVYPGYIVREQPLNILYISSAIKKAGHQTRLFEITPYRKRPLWGDEYRIIKKKYTEIFTAFKPDVVGFSVMSVNYRIAAILARLSKKIIPGIPVIFGGIHPTIAPQQTIEEDCIDIICRGEGEEAVTELLDAMESGKDITSIKGLWVKSRGKIHRNPVRPLVKNIDSIPFPDRDSLRASNLQAELYGVNLISSRGCPFPCSYCQNKFLMDLYRGKGEFVRYRSIENVFREIDEIIHKYKASRLSFSDESFTLNKKHLKEFCGRYKKTYNIPFLCQTRPDLVDEEKISMLKDAGCDFINMAIESGNPKIRNRILKRNISTTQIVEAFRLARKYGIRTGSFNMIGLPEEDMSTIWNTININRKLQPERIMCTVYMPFHGTELGEKCLAAGWLQHPIDDSEVYYTFISIKHPSLPGKTLFGYQGFFDYYVRLPSSLHWLVNLLRHLYQLLPKTHHAPPLLRAFREFVIDSVYRMKIFLPSRGFFMKTR